MSIRAVDDSIKGVLLPWGEKRRVEEIVWNPSVLVFWLMKEVSEVDKIGCED
jgi:hypothetical protein